MCLGHVRGAGETLAREMGGLRASTGVPGHWAGKREPSEETGRGTDRRRSLRMERQKPSCGENLVLGEASALGTAPPLKARRQWGLSGPSGRRGVTLAAERRRQNQAPWVQIMRRQISSRHLLEVFSPLEMPHRRGPCLRGGERPVIVHDPKGGRQPLAGGPGHWEFQEIRASRPPSGRDPLGRGSGEGAGRTRPLASSRRVRFVPRGAAKMTYTNRPSQAIPTSPSTP